VLHAGHLYRQETNSIKSLNLGSGKMIKNFLYLDQEKMYSLSSQMFEGVTAHVLTESTSTNEDSKTQKGPVGSGLVLAEAIRSNIRNTEKNSCMIIHTLYSKMNY
jgi:hypothetical protein